MLNIRSLPQKLLREMLLLFFERVCLNCEQPNNCNTPVCLNCQLPEVFSKTTRCEICFDLIPAQNFSTKAFGLCPSCQVTPKYDAPLLYAWDYQGLVSKLIIKMKASPSETLAKFLAESLIHALKINQFANECDLIITPPLSARSRKLRLFNQSALIAKLVAAELNLKFYSGVLKANSFQNEQKHLNRSERITNKSFFVKNQNIISGAKVLLIDDILTTGATLNSAAKAIWGAGAKSLKFAVLAKTPLLFVPVQDATTPNKKQSN